MSSTKSIAVTSLLLDESNYRIDDVGSQREAYTAMVGNSMNAKKLLKLAADIVENGLSPIEKILVYPSQNQAGKYIVHDGNRRITALKLLTEPTIIKDAALSKRFKQIAESGSFPRKVECVIVKDREEGRIWVDRRHGIALAGYGMEGWNSHAIAKYQAESGIVRPELLLLSYAVTHIELPADVKAIASDPHSFPLTTLQRVVSDPNLKKEIGMTVVDGQLSFSKDNGFVDGMIRDVVTAIATKQHEGQKLTSRTLNTAPAISEFVRSVKGQQSSEPKTSKPWSPKGTTPTAKDNSPKSSKPKPKPPMADRKCLFTPNFRPTISDPRSDKIFHEIKKLDVNSYPNAVSFLMRGFLEISINHYCLFAGIKLYHVADPAKQNERTSVSLIEKMKKCYKHLEQKTAEDPQLQQALNKAWNNEHDLAHVSTFHAYVHNHHVQPTAQSLKIGWELYEAFLSRLYEHMSPTRS